MYLQELYWTSQIKFFTAIFIQQSHPENAGHNIVVTQPCRPHVNMIWDGSKAIKPAIYGDCQKHQFQSSHAPNIATMTVYEACIHAIIIYYVMLGVLSFKSPGSQFGFYFWHTTCKHDVDMIIILCGSCDSLSLIYLQLWNSVVLILGVQKYVLTGTNWTEKGVRPASVKVKCVASIIL